MAVAGRVRLHITPFNPDLLERYIPTSLKPQASNISFHTIETFPELGFGYVELPAMDAQKLKSKLNGSKLKGTKVKIEEARPEKKRNLMDEDRESENGTVRKKARTEKKKREIDVIPGHVLEDERHVKRGWVEDSGRNKTRKTGKDSDKDTKETRKMLFKTEIPPNAILGDNKIKKAKKTDSEAQKEDRGRAGKTPAVVKEFSKNKKFVGSHDLATTSKVSSYEEGVGWIGEHGKVIEPEPPSKKKKPRSVAEPQPTSKQYAESASNSAVVSEPGSEDEQPSTSSGAEDDSSDESTAEDHDDNVTRQLDEAKSNAERNVSVEHEQQVSIPVNTAADRTPEEREIHPLEALFKRNVSPSVGDRGRRPVPARIDTSFNFFGDDGQDEDDVMVQSIVPQTPRTKEDLEWRSQRSAAPTPDTAAPGKRFSFTFDQEDEDDDDDSADRASSQHELPPESTENGERQESEFRKWFYDNRGDLNRAWKKRRREERKIVRQRENRRLSKKIA